MNFIRVILFAGVLITVASCAKEEEPAPPPPPTNYQPVSSGSTWTYAGFNGGSNYNIEMLGWVDTINGKAYNSYEHSLYGTCGFRKENGSYYNLYLINGTPVEMLYMKDNEAVGGTWTVQHNLNGTDTKITYTILAKGQKKIVNGYIYNDVIVLQADIYYDLGSGYVLSSTGMQYYANDVGFVFSDMSAEGMTYLDFYSIK